MDVSSRNTLVVKHKENVQGVFYKLDRLQEGFEKWLLSPCENHMVVTDW